MRTPQEKVTNLRELLERRFGPFCTPLQKILTSFNASDTRLEGEAK
jgi:hypothetical protein